MFEWVKARVLRLMRVPHEPEPPLGAPGSVRVFRAGLNHYRLRVLRWYFGQAGAIVGIGFSLVALGAFEMGVDQAAKRAALPLASPTVEASPESPGPSPSARSSRSREERRQERERAIKAFVSKAPPYLIPLIEFIEFAGIAIFLAQLVVTYAIVRLEFEQHWYIVTDRSLRIRTGILRLQESTMSFANIQQVEIRQGPLQRLLADHGAQRGVECREGLVEQDQCRLGGEGPGQRHPLLLAPGKLVGIRSAPLPQTHLAQ